MIEIVYLANNRLEFTKATTEALIRNTNWKLVSAIYVYDDDSTDGTREYLQSVEYPVRRHLRFGKFGSPVKVMNLHLDNDASEPTFAKIDNDTVVPPGWLDECVRIQYLHPGLDFMGIEAFRPVKAAPCDRSFDDAEFVGGIGLFRTRAFSDGCRPVPDGRFGFTKFQQKHPHITKGWINPALPVFLLDWLPREPWLTLTRESIEKGWARDWHDAFPNLCPYPEERKDLWNWYCE